MLLAAPGEPIAGVPGPPRRGPVPGQRSCSSLRRSVCLELRHVRRRERHIGRSVPSASFAFRRPNRMHLSIFAASFCADSY